MTKMKRFKRVLNERHGALTGGGAAAGGPRAPRLGVDGGAALLLRAAALLHDLLRAAGRPAALAGAGL